jgi:hypothetical protein
MQRRDNGSVSIILGAGPDAIPAERDAFDATVICQSGKAEAPFLSDKERKKQRKKNRQVENMVVHVD